MSEALVSLFFLIFAFSTNELTYFPKPLRRNLENKYEPQGSRSVPEAKRLAQAPMVSTLFSWVLSRGNFYQKIIRGFGKYGKRISYRLILATGLPRLSYKITVSRCGCQRLWPRPR